MAVSPLGSSLLLSRSVQLTGARLAQSLEALATGRRINSGGDDPAGLISSERLRAALAEIDAESASLERARGVVDTAEGGLAAVGDLVTDARALVVAGADSTLSDEERQAIQLELDSVVASIDSIAASTSFGGQPLLDGSLVVEAAGTSMVVESAAAAGLGVVEQGGETFSIADLASGGGIDLAGGDVDTAQAILDAAGAEVAARRGELGAFSRYTIGSRLESLAVSRANVAAAESAIGDTDYAEETATVARLQVAHRAGLTALRILADRSIFDTVV